VSVATTTKPAAQPDDVQVAPAPAPSFMVLWPKVSIQAPEGSGDTVTGPDGQVWDVKDGFIVPTVGARVDSSIAPDEHLARLVTLGALKGL
jgi:hypothetical protein